MIPEPPAVPAAASAAPEPRSSWLRRLLSFHRDRSGQVMPLVFFLGIAFFTCTTLAINTGQDVTHRVETQDACDAAAVTAATTVARGMNYIASNNIQMAKILASIVILRAFPPAIEDALNTLDVWKAVAAGMIAAGNALAATVFGAAAGAALVAIGTFIQEVKIPQEEAVLEAVKGVIEPIRDAWAGSDDDGEQGAGWALLRVLAKAGDALAYFTPLIAQYAAKEIYKKNLTGEAREGDAWVIPLYPAMPACRGKFEDFKEHTEKFTERYSEPIIILGWIVVTLSLFPLHFENRAGQKLRALFTGDEGSSTVDDPSQAQIEALQEQLEEKRQELVEVEAQIAQVEAELADLRQRQQDGEDGLEGEIAQKEQELAILNAKAENLQDEIEDIQRQMSDIAENRAPNNGSDQPGAGTPPADTSPDMDATGGAAVQDRPDYYPWMIDPTDWKIRSTYTVLAWRTLEAPFGSGVYKHAYDTGWVYAQSRLMNPTRADLWTPDWRAKLVRVRQDAFPTNPFGRLPDDCGEEGDDAGGTVSSSFDGSAVGSFLLDKLAALVGAMAKH